MKGGMFPWYSDLWSSSQAIPVEKKRIRKKVNKILCYTCTLLYLVIPFEVLCLIRLQDDFL